MMMKKLIPFIACMLMHLQTEAQSVIVRDFMPVCDSLSSLILERNAVKGKLELKSIMKRGGFLDFYFTESLSDYPWQKEDAAWFKRTLNSLFPENYASYKVGEIYSRRVALDKLVTPHLGTDGKPAASRLKVKGHVRKPAIVTELDGAKYSKGLTGRHIALWQSHGRYYEKAFDRWEWQRACLFQTVEDMFTQSFVLPYLVPMLENAGAYVMLPRERDLQRNEIIPDNDPSCGKRGTGSYKESGNWTDAGTGFADPRPIYTDGENPFTFGTSRKASCIAHGRKGGQAEAVWTPDIPEKGRYGVYVSYTTLPESTSSACYTVVHSGGSSKFVVNQKMGGGTWVYLGTFEFDKGAEGYVKLENRTPKGWRYHDGSVVTADAVRFGGGMGNIARGEDSPETSGMPRSAEAARYWLQWAGSDTTIYSQNKGIDDYKDDFMCRGDWVGELSGGSEVNPEQKGRRIPIDLSLGFHSDAGVTPNDSTIGTLAIYTLKSEGKQTYPSGEDRMASREFADLVQSQLIRDLRSQHDEGWARRSIWDRGYRESRTPPVPSMLVELLSHQNFADMKFGLDPKFRFTASRAVYKGMLKYLSNRYGCDYAVQPLPVESMAVEFTDNSKALISWVPVRDSLEPTADPEYYILETRIDDGCFSERVIKDIRNFGDRTCVKTDIEPGHIYSFRIRACNDGGMSFPSETVSIGMPSSDDKNIVLIVNNFDRISAPSFIDRPDYAGFTGRNDSGVPYISDISYVGEMYQYRRGLEWKDDDNPGFGASYCDHAGEVIAGNTFDYPYIHGKAVLKAGYPFISCSRKAFCSYRSIGKGVWALDMICGKQVTTVKGSLARASLKHTVFPRELQETVREYADQGVNIVTSGAYIGTDIWDRVYEYQQDSTFRAGSIEFAENILGYRWIGGHASNKAEIRACRNTLQDYTGMKTFTFSHDLNKERYCVESPDGLIPAGKNACTVMRYTDTGISAGVCCDMGTYRTASFGFPIESLEEDGSIETIISTTLEYFRNR